MTDNDVLRVTELVADVSCGATIWQAAETASEIATKERVTVVMTFNDRRLRVYPDSDPRSIVCRYQNMVENQLTRR